MGGPLHGTCCSLIEQEGANEHEGVAGSQDDVQGEGEQEDGAKGSIELGQEAEERGGLGQVILQGGTYN